jgi:hypothetical protein
MTLQQVFYVSRCTGGPAAVAAIHETARRHNAAHGLTGVLLYTGGCFAQLLEGPADALDTVMTALTADPRHTALRRLLEGPVSERRFGAWSMALLEEPGADELLQQLLAAPEVPPERVERLIAHLAGGLVDRT